MCKLYINEVATLGKLLTIGTCYIGTIDIFLILFVVQI